MQATALNAIESMHCRKEPVPAAVNHRLLHMNLQPIVPAGGQWNQLKDWGEIDMSKPETVSRFLAEGLVR